MTEKRSADYIAGLKRAAEIARAHGWVLPLHDSAEINELTDDLVCAVQEQIATAIEREAGDG